MSHTGWVLALFLENISISAQSLEDLFTFNIFSGQEMHLVDSVVYFFVQQICKYTVVNLELRSQDMMECGCS